MKLRLLFYFLFLTNVCLSQKNLDNSVRVEENNIVYENPKAYELMHIAVALTDSSIISNGYKAYSVLIDTSTLYYKEVMQYFSKFKNHPLVTELNKSLEKSSSSYIQNVQLGYISAFQDQKLRKTKNMPWGRRTYISLSSVKLKLANDFAKVSGFEKFYDDHRNYYEQVLNKTKEIADVNKQQIWLEKQFPFKYKYYNIAVSPLMYGTHFTQRFMYEGDRKCVMWVAMPNKVTNTNKVAVAQYTGIVMTEIDHNYVNPVSDGYTKQLKKIMGEENRKYWVKANFNSNAYKDGYKVFNEYMTHGAYLLYFLDILSPNEQSDLEKGKIAGMQNNRGFINYGNFYNELKRLFLERKPGETVESLYPAIIEWCNKQNRP